MSCRTCQRWPRPAGRNCQGYEIVSWQAVFAPAGTPAPIVNRLATDIGKIIQEPDMRARLAALGIEPSGAGPAELGAFQKSEVAKWAQLIKTREYPAGMTPAHSSRALPGTQAGPGGL
ncbi:tripartite tricarboxylate transporter substrate-binding protein [Cupriavidus basilensis]